jgi:hypothetical protein
MNNDANMFLRSRFRFANCRKGYLQIDVENGDFGFEEMIAD